MADMIKFFKGLEASLPTAGANGALYITTDEGAIYLGTGTGMKRLGDFVQVANVESLPEKAHESCLYYCVAENILAKWNGTEWKQINKQKTLDELGGVSKSAYDVKIAALEKADSDNATAISGVDARLQTAEEKLKSVATTEGLGELTDRVTGAENDIDALQADSHTHTFADSDVEDAISKKHAHTFADADVEDAIYKKHAHTFVESELNKIAAGDVAKWNGVLADHLTAADKTALEDSIGDVNTALETYKTSNNEALAGVKATADAAAVKTEVESALSGKVDKVEGKSLISDSEIARLANVTNYDDTQVKADIAKKADAEAMTTELGKKVDKVEGYSLISDEEITRLAGVNNYDDTALAGRVTTAEGKITALETESAKHALKTEVEAVDAKFADYKTAEAQKAIDDAQDARIKAIEDDYLVEADIANFETKENVKKVADDLAAYVESNDAAIADRYTKAEADGKFALIADAYDDEEVRGLISDNADAIAAEAERAAGIEAGLREDVDAIAADYLKAADKAGLQEQITANANAITLLTEGADPDKVDSVKDLIDYVDKHGAEVTGMKEDIAENAKAISDHEAIAAETYETKTDAGNKLTEAKEYANGLNTAMNTRVEALEAIDHDHSNKTVLDGITAEKVSAWDNAQANAEATAAGALAAAKTEISAEIDADVKALADGAVATNAANIAANAEAIATKANAADVYTKAEVEALLTWGEF